MRGVLRRIAVAAVMSGLVFVLLWLMAFSVFTSLLIASGCCVVVVAAGAVLDPVEWVLDAIASIVSGVLGIIAALFSTIFSIFGH